MNNTYKLKENGLWGPELDEEDIFDYDTQIINEVLHKCEKVYTNSANYTTRRKAERDPEIDRMLSYYERHAADDYIKLSTCDKVAYQINEYLNTIVTEPEYILPWNGCRDFIIHNKCGDMFIGVFRYANGEIHVTTHIVGVHDIILKDGRITSNISDNNIMRELHCYLQDHLNDIFIL